MLHSHPTASSRPSVGDYPAPYRTHTFPSHLPLPNGGMILSLRNSTGSQKWNLVSHPYSTLPIAAPFIGIALLYVIQQPRQPLAVEARLENHLALPNKPTRYRAFHCRKRWIHNERDALRPTLSIPLQDKI